MNTAVTDQMIDQFMRIFCGHRGSLQINHNELSEAVRAGLVVVLSASAQPPVVQSSDVMSKPIIGTHQFFSYDPDTGFERHDTEKMAKDYAEKSIDLCLDGEFNEDVEKVCWGVVHEVAVKVSKGYDPHRKLAHTCVYRLSPFRDAYASVTAELTGTRAQLAAAHAVLRIFSSWDDDQCGWGDAGIRARDVSRRALEKVGTYTATEQQRGDAVDVKP
jgi:hypothetical protein